MPKAIVTRESSCELYDIFACLIQKSPITEMHHTQNHRRNSLHYNPFITIYIERECRHRNIISLHMEYTR